MKKILLLFILIGFSFAATINAQVQKTVLLEEYTNASCGPCASQNPGFNTLLDANEDKVVAIKYQTNFPGYDPMNEQNASESSTRWSYYPSMTGVPTVAMNGIIPDDGYAGGIGGWDVAGGGYAGGPYGYNQAVVDNEYSVMTPIEIVLDHNLSEDLSSISITCTVKNVSADPFALTDGKVRVVLLEEEINFATAPGSNGETAFFDVMRKMYPNADGSALSDIPAGDSVVFTFDETLPDYIYNLGAIAVVAFVQDDSDKSVHQAALSNPKPLTGDIVDAALDGETEEPEGLCNPYATPTVKVTNEGGTEITSFDIAYSINDGTAVSQSWTGSLMTGDNVVIEFDEISLPGGVSNLSYDISNVNGGFPDYNPANNVAIETFSAISDDPIGTSLESDVEDVSAGEIPANSLKISYAAAGAFGLNDFSFTAIDVDMLSGFGIDDAGDDIGGYGESSKSILIDYYQWNPSDDSMADEGGLMYFKVDLTDVTNTMLSYDRAGARYSGSNDRLQFLISEDCGDTWTVVQDIEGADLSTVDGHTEDFYVPGAGEWETDEVEISEFDGSEGVYLKMNAISAWGNCTYIDNIKVQGTVGNENITRVLEGVDIFPNPTNDVVNIRFNVETASDVSIKVFDVTGKLVTILENNTHFNSGQFEKTWKNIPNKGVYSVKIRTEYGEVTKKIVVL